MFDIRPVLFANGVLLLVLAAAMALPLLVDLAATGGESPAFAAAMAVTGFVGAALALGGRGRGHFGLGGRQGFLFAASGLGLAALFGALPLLLGSYRLSVTDALFEAVSGITTTGATVMTGLDRAPAAVLLWRALLQWLGGAAVIIAALALLPMLRIGGMQIFRVDSSDGVERQPTRLPRQAGALLLVYGLLTVLLALGFAAAGLNRLESVCLAMSTLSTGGFSTSDGSFAKFGDEAAWLCVVGMLLGGINLALLIAPWRGSRWRILKDTQIRWYLLTALGFALLLAFWHWAVDGRSAYDALRRAAFQSASTLSTTGFRLSEDHGWGGFPHVVLFVMCFIGGCTGSAAGSIKTFRYEVLFAVAGLHVDRMLNPHGVFSVTFNRLRLPDMVLRSVLGFFMLYFCCFAALASGLALFGLDPWSSLSAAAAAVGNVGGGIGPILGVSGGDHALPGGAKALLAFGMLLGRLELAPVLVLMSPSFWKD